MKTQKIVSQKKAVSGKASVKPVGGIISGKRKLTLSRKQKVVTVFVAALAVVGVGYGVYNYTYMNESFAGKCVGSTYAKDSRHKCVKFAQQMLGISADGVFGKNTRTAVNSFQKKHGLTVDGKIGPKTWAKLCSVSTNKAAKSDAGCPQSTKTTSVDSKTWHTVRSAYINKRLNTGDAVASQSGFDGKNNTVLEAGKTYKFCVIANGNGKFHFYGAPDHKKIITVNNEGGLLFCSNSIQNKSYSRSSGVGVSVDSGSIYFGKVLFKEYK